MIMSEGVLAVSVPGGDTDFDFLSDVFASSHSVPVAVREGRTGWANSCRATLSCVAHRSIETVKIHS